MLRASTAAVFRLSRDGQTLQGLGAVGYTPEMLSSRQSVPLSLDMPVTDAVRARSALFLTAQQPDDQYPQIALPVPADRASASSTPRALVALP